MKRKKCCKSNSLDRLEYCMCKLKLRDAAVLSKNDLDRMDIFTNKKTHYFLLLTKKYINFKLV